MRRNGLVVVGGLVFIALAYFIFRNEFAAPPDPLPAIRESKVEPKPRLTAPAPAPIEEPTDEAVPTMTAKVAEPETVELPPLAGSDAFVRRQVEGFGLPSEWTSQAGLVRKLAVLADGVGRGEWPRKPIDFMKPPGRFDVIEKDGRLYADPRNAARFDAAIDLLESIDPDSAARTLDLLGPLLDAALRELGATDDGRTTMIESIDTILETPEVQGEYELVRPKVLYVYADPEIESRPPLEKQLLRLGPNNALRVKKYLGRLREGMDRTAR